LKVVGATIVYSGATGTEVNQFIEILTKDSFLPHCATIIVTTLLVLLRETAGIHWETQTYHVCRLREQNA